MPSAQDDHRQRNQEGGPRKFSSRHFNPPRLLQAFASICCFNLQAELSSMKSHRGPQGSVGISNNLLAPEATDAPDN
jgi:hypothetical protein